MQEKKWRQRKKIRKKMLTRLKNVEIQKAKNKMFCFRFKFNKQFVATANIQSNLSQ